MGVLLRFDYTTKANSDHRTAYVADSDKLERKARIFFAVCEADKAGVLKHIPEWKDFTPDLIEFDDVEDDISALGMLFDNEQHFPDFPVEAMATIVADKKYVKDTLNGISDFSDLPASDTSEEEDSEEDELTPDAPETSYNSEDLSDILDNDND